MASTRKGIEFQNQIWRHRPRLTSSQLQLQHSGQILMPDKELLAQKSEKITSQLQRNPNDDLSSLLCNSNVNQESMEILVRFCHGFEPNLSPENVVPLACLANSLGMTDSHCPNNLLNKALCFFEKQIMPSWNNSIKALKTAENMLRQAQDLGLIDCCVETLILKALEDPRLLGEPMNNGKEEDRDSEDWNIIERPYRPPNARRKLFDSDWRSEDVTTLPLRFYAPIIHAMIKRQVPLNYVAANLHNYVKIWIFCNDDKLGDEMPFEKMKALRETIEVLVSLFPPQIGLFPCTFLCETLRFAIAVEASDDCRKELEVKIGMQLEEATTKDLLLPCHGYANQDKYDTDCLRRILTHFYSKEAGLDHRSLIAVAELIDEFLAEIAADIDLRTTAFLRVAEISIAASEGVERGCDGIYRAIDVYLEKHKHLTESEKEDLCRILDCNKLSSEAVAHAAVNERLPVRVVVHVLFASQLKLREAVIPRKGGMMMQGGEEKLMLKMEEEQEEEEGEGGEGGMMRMEMEKMGSKVSELERECKVMRREMVKKRHKKLSVWREMKRKFGCMTSMHDCDCYVNVKNNNKKKKVYPR